MSSLISATAASETSETEAASPTDLRRVLLDSLYALSAFPIAVAAFSLVVVVLTLGLGLSIVVVGVPLISVAVQIARRFARLERGRLRSMQGRLVPSPEYRSARYHDGFWHQTLVPLRDPQSWRDVSWTLVGALSGTAAFTVTLTWWAVAAGGLTHWLWQGLIPPQSDTITLASALGLGQGRTTESAVNFAVGVVALATLPLVIRLAAAIHAKVATALLAP